MDSTATPVAIDNATIIARGYVLTEEYEAMHAANKLEKINLLCAAGDSEGIWVQALGNSDTPGEKFHFVFFNDPVEFLGGPRPIAGMVGIATSKGREQRADANSSECIELFKKAGAPAIEYFWEQHKKHMAEEEAKKAKPDV